VKLGIAVTNYSWPGGPAAIAEALQDLAESAEQAGIDTFWVADHLLQMDPNAAVDEPMLEAYTTLGYLAAATTSVGLGTMVTWASIRPPALVVKAVTTLDVLTGGRAWLGAGAGYRGDEAAMMGLPFEPTAQRFERLEELLQLADHMWRGDRRPFDGPHHRLTAPSAARRPSGGPASWSAAWASGALCRSSPATPTPATSSTFPPAAPPSAASSTLSPGPAMRSAVTSRTSRSR
jgi:alkanesulfonate monooxygenase SsuD/methylene tetrahydromethanopterin reductase-like flavin-dependent oxidoreductase (luciferase family)